MPRRKNKEENALSDEEKHELMVERVKATKAKQKAEGVTFGPPSVFNQEIADRICLLVATHPISMKRLRAMYPELPHDVTIWEWRIKHPEFGKQFMEAKKNQVLLYIEETYDIADDESRDLITTDKGLSVNSAAVARDKLKVDVRRWFATTLLPKIFKETVNQEITVITHEQSLKELE